MAIDPTAVGTASDPQHVSWGSKDAILYALGVGAGTEELALTTENTQGVPQQVLPSYAVVVGGALGDIMERIGDYDPGKIVHAEQSFHLHSTIPVEGRVRTVSRIAGIYDKGSGALVDTVSTSEDAETGEPRFETRSSAFIRGFGGFGGERGPSSRFDVPDGAPDAQVTDVTSPDQALLYRLSGDRNPLHSDPAFARAAGFDRPILHGLCTYGFTCRAALHAVADGDPARIRGMSGRFTAPVLPGESLRVDLWRDEAGASFATFAEDDRQVLVGRVDVA